MKRTTILFLMLLLIKASGFSQGCLPGGIIFATQQQIDDFQSNYPGCFEILGDVYIRGDDIIDLSGINVLIAVGGDLTIGNPSINSNPALTGLTGLNNVVSIGGNLNIQQNVALVSLTGLDNLVSIGGQLDIFANDLLISLIGLDSVSFIGGDLLITGNDAIENFTGLGNITSVNGKFWISGNDALTNLTGLDNLTTVVGEFMIRNSDSLINLTGLGNLTTINGTLVITENQNLQNLEGLDNLMSIGQTFFINRNHSLINLSGLGNLTTINWTLSIGDWYYGGNDALESLSGLENLVTVGSNFAIYDNPSLLNVLALNSLMEIGGELYIQSNHSLTNLAGLDSIQAESINNLHIASNENLSTCEVKSVCDYLVNPNGTITISGNAPGCNNQIEVDEACWSNTDKISEGATNIQIFPNPAKKTITLLNPSSIKIEGIKIYNPAGQLILQKQNPINSIDISSMQSGLYFVEVEIKNGKVRKKLIVE